MRRILVTLSYTLLGACLLVACGPGGVGEACQGGAATNDCVDGAICTLERSEEMSPPAHPNNETFVCRTLCDRHADCEEEGFLCLRAEGTMFNSCQPDPNAPPTME